ncbi:MAG: DUF4407 domain-containing protein [Phyllobacteriaceae bacterium]|nr:DUF4407 domain-containing protein [Phyllobacteriaceae bacterium]
MGFLYFLAGVDRDLIEKSSRIDRIWAAQIGVSLIFTYVFVAAITFFSLNYFLGATVVVVAVALVVAGIVTLFDRALMISDWLNIGLIDELAQHVRNRPLRQKIATLPYGRVIKVFLRVAVSLVIALTLSLLAEAALFGPTLRASLERDNFAANADYRAAMADKENELRAAIAAQAAIVADIDKRLDPLALAPVEPMSLATAAEKARLEDLRGAENSAKERMAALEEANRTLRRDIHAEKTGASVDKKYTGRPGCNPGSRCDIYKLDLSENEIELQSVTAALERHRADQAALVEALERRADSRLPSELQVAEFRARRDAAAGRVRALEQSLAADLAAKEAELRASGVHVPLGDDPIARVHQLSVIKADPKIGPTIAALSLAVRLFIAFLEVAPVIAKIFFSPASAYAIWLRQEIAHAQSEARMMTLATMKKASGREEEVAQLVHELNLRRAGRLKRRHDADAPPRRDATGEGAA